MRDHLRIPGDELLQLGKHGSMPAYLQGASELLSWLLHLGTSKEGLSSTEAAWPFSYALVVARQHARVASGMCLLVSLLCRVRWGRTVPTQRCFSTSPRSFSRCCMHGETGKLRGVAGACAGQASRRGAAAAVVRAESQSVCGPSFRPGVSPSCGSTNRHQAGHNHRWRLACEVRLLSASFQPLPCCSGLQPQARNSQDCCGPCPPFPCLGPNLSSTLRPWRRSHAAQP